MIKYNSLKHIIKICCFIYVFYLYELLNILFYGSPLIQNNLRFVRVGFSLIYIRIQSDKKKVYHVNRLKYLSRSMKIMSFDISNN